MTKKEAEEIFRRDVLPYIKQQFEKDGVKDMPARSQAWNDFTDSLCKDGKITFLQYRNWVSPKICS